MGGRVTSPLTVPVVLSVAMGLSVMTLSGFFTEGTPRMGFNHLTQPI
jgi:hypothetical protein